MENSDCDLSFTTHSGSWRLRCLPESFAPTAFVLRRHSSAIPQTDFQAKVPRTQILRDPNSPCVEPAPVVRLEDYDGPMKTTTEWLMVPFGKGCFMPRHILSSPIVLTERACSILRSGSVPRAQSSSATPIIPATSVALRRLRRASDSLFCRVWGLMFCASSGHKFRKNSIFRFAGPAKRKVLERLWRLTKVQKGFRCLA
jgi:hypothetical protein